eukprot:765521-Hanusia_phi.AAC.6
MPKEHFPQCTSTDFSTRYGGWGSGCQWPAEDGGGVRGRLTFKFLHVPEIRHCGVKPGIPDSQGPAASMPKKESAKTREANKKAEAEDARGEALTSLLSLTSSSSLSLLAPHYAASVQVSLLITLLAHPSPPLIHPTSFAEQFSSHAFAVSLGYFFLFPQRKIHTLLRRFPAQAAEDAYWSHGSKDSSKHSTAEEKRLAELRRKEERKKLEVKSGWMRQEMFVTKINPARQGHSGFTFYFIDAPGETDECLPMKGTNRPEFDVHAPEEGKEEAGARDRTKHQSPANGGGDAEMIPGYSDSV